MVSQTSSPPTESSFQIHLFVVWWLGDVFLDGVDVIRSQAVCQLLYVLGEAADGFVLFNDGFVKRLGKLLHVCQ